MSMANLQRTQVELSDDKDGRIYFDRLKNTYPSVTTVFMYRDDPGKERALAGWRNKYDGKNGSPYHEHIGDYSRWRGTLIHWYILHFLDPSLPVTDDEHEAIADIEANDHNYDFVRSIALNHDQFTDASFPSEQQYNAISNDPDYDDPVSLGDLWVADTAWAAIEFTKFLSEMGLANQSFADSDCKTLESYYKRDVRQSQIIATEEYVTNDTYRYAGQFDCLYENDDGDVVLLDIKTGKRIYWDYPRQLTAYAKAIESSAEFPDHVDSLQIARIKPDNQDSELATDAWATRESLWNDFTALAEQTHDDIDAVDLTTDTDVSHEWFTQQLNA